MFDYDKYTRYVIENFHQGDYDFVLLELRKMGASQMESVNALVNALRISLAESDKIVLNSKTWSNQIDDNTYLRNTLLDATEEHE